MTNTPTREEVLTEEKVGAMPLNEKLNLIANKCEFRIEGLGVGEFMTRGNVVIKDAVKFKIKHNGKWSTNGVVDIDSFAFKLVCGLYEIGGWKYGVKEKIKTNQTALFS